MIGRAAFHFLILALALAAPKSEISAQTLRVTRGPVELLLVESGDLEAVRSLDLSAPGGWGEEPMIVFLAPEGTRAAVGDTLVLFDTADIESRILDAKALVERREADIRSKQASQKQNISSLRSRLRNAEFAAEQAQIQLDRMKFSAETERQSAQLSLDRAVLQSQEAEVKLDAQAVLDSLEVAQLRTGLVQARADLERERDQLGRMVFTAPNAGLVIHGEAGDDDRKVREGDRVRAGTVVIRLPDLSELQANVSVHEIDRVRLREGLAVRVGFDAFSDLLLDGHVKQIAQLANPARRRSRIQRFDAFIEISGSDPRLRPGMTVRAEIIADARDDVLRVPRAALAARDGQSVVVRDNGDVVPVKTGLVTSTYVELLEGPREGTELRRPSGLQPFSDVLREIESTNGSFAKE